MGPETTEEERAEENKRQSESQLAWVLGTSMGVWRWASELAFPDPDSLDRWASELASPDPDSL